MNRTANLMLTKQKHQKGIAEAIIVERNGGLKIGVILCDGVFMPDAHEIYPAEMATVQMVIQNFWLFYDNVNEHTSSKD